VRTLRLAGGTDTVYKCPLACGDLDAFADNFILYLCRQFADWDVLVLDSLRAGSGWGARWERACAVNGLHVELHPSKPAPFLSLPADYATLRQGLKKSLRQNLARRTNMARREAVTFERYSGTAFNLTHMLIAQDVEQRSWKGRKKLGIFHDARHCKFHQDLVNDTDKSLQPDLVLVKASGVPIAFQYGFIHDKCYYAYNTSYDEAYSHLSAGMLAINRLLEDLTTEGIELVDFLIGEDAYKWDWTSEVTQLDGLTAYNSSLRGRLALAVRKTRRHARVARQLLRRTISAS
jgi:CelD/BcsL family acetyltransferase involved in cellulose biosynthesis